MLRLAALLLALGVSIGALAGSQGPAPGGPNSGHKPQEQSAIHGKCPTEQQRGTEDAPLVIKVTPAEIEQPPTPSYTCYQNSQASNNDLWLDLATTVLALITLGIFGYTAKLANATIKLVENTREDSKRELRAYVGIDEDLRPDIIQGEIKDDFVVFVAEIKNFGKTPAYDVEMTISAKSFPEPLPPGFVFPEPGKKKRNTHVLNPGHTSWMRMRPLKKHLPDVWAGKASFYVFGHVSYWDVFREVQRHTHIRCKIEMPKEEGGRAHWFFCEEGNKAT